MKRRVMAIGVSVVALAAPGFGADDPGKAVYEQTCKECHGEKGGGVMMADSFYKLTIPRLNSKYVQDKSDKELKEIITSGRRKMKPVRAGQPSMQHRVKPDWVDDVIAYVRTFKQKS